jgi:hypothetical protein
VRSRLDNDDPLTQYNTFFNSLETIKDGKVYQDSLLKNTAHLDDPVKMRDTAYKWGKANGEGKSLYANIEKLQKVVRNVQGTDRPIASRLNLEPTAYKESYRRK